MKALSSSARLNVPGLCLITALAAACSLDTSQLRALADGAVEHPGVPDAPVATGGSGGTTGTGGVGGMGGSSGAGGVSAIGGTTNSTVGTTSPTGGTAGSSGGSTISSGGSSGSTGGSTGSGTGNFSVTGVNLGQVATNAVVHGAVTVTATAPVTDLSCSLSGVDLTADPTKVCPAALAAGASCTVGFTFKAITSGQKTDSVVCNAAGLTKTAVVSATVLDPATLVITPTSTAFQTPNGTQSAPVTFGVANSGGMATGQVSATITGTNANQFAITVPGCLAPLAGASGCTVQVVCNPTSVGTKTATLTVADATTASDSVTAALTCSSVGPTTLTVTGTANLGAVVVGKTGAPQTFTVTNPGTTATGTLTVTVASTTQFVTSLDTCTGASLAPAATCTVAVALKPSAPGQLGTILNVTAAGGASGSAQLSGTGLPPGALTISPSSNDFGSIPINTVSADVSFTVSNGGGAATGALTVSAPGNGFVVAGNGCGAALQPTQTCVMAIHFAPTIVGIATGTVTVTDGTLSGSATLHGTATPAATPPPDAAIDTPAVPDGPVATQGLVLYYSCDQINGTTLPDLSGNGNNGTLVGPVAVGAGKIGSGALVFTATNNVDAAASGGYLAMPAGILSTSTNMTIATWFKINSNLQYQHIFDIGGVGGTGAATASMYLTPNGNTGHLQFTIRTAQPDGGAFTREDITDGTPSGTPTTMSTGVWWHVAVVLDATGGHLYLNGNQVGSTTPMTMRPPSLGNTPNDWIGRSEFVANPYLDGAIDEFRIYNRALSATEISSLYSYAGH